MSIITLLDESNELEFRIRYRFGLLSLEKKFKFVMTLTNLKDLSKRLVHKKSISDIKFLNLINKGIPIGLKQTVYTLEDFREAIIDKYIDLYPEYGNLDLSELTYKIYNDTDFMENYGPIQILIYMLKNGIGSFCYDW